MSTSGTTNDMEDPPSKYTVEELGQMMNRTWDEFLIAVKHHFDPDIYIDHLGTLATLRQTGSIEAYQTAFEDTMQRLSNVSDDTLMSLFIAGLRDPIKKDLLTRRPSSLNEAFALAQQVAACQILLTGAPPTPKSSLQDRETRQRNFSSGLSTTVQHRQGQAPPGQNRPPYPIIKVSAAKRAEKQRKNECYYCPEKYTRDHVCSKKFYALIGEDDEEFLDDPNEETNTDLDGENMVITGDVSSIHMVNPRLKPRSIRLLGTINGKTVNVLIDRSSTHNFIKPAVAEQLSLPVLSGHAFEVYLYILQVEGPDVILGVQWLQELGDVTKNYKELTMRFELGDKQIFLQGEAADQPTPDPPSPDPLPFVDPVLGVVLAKFQPVFAVPTALPPARRWDHRIHLAHPNCPINVRPYRYPYFQKTEIERLVQEMLEQRVIQHSTSAFSSPVLLVCKKDGTFRFCVDYHALNAATTPDHFPIPTADELFDELHAARIFTKLDLRSGYHQIRMQVDDIHKTTFRTHDGHFEFLVMPFGLTNAPSTFQAAMNGVFQPFLRKFVIVFFDDILVYSSSIQDHVGHLSQVLTILAENCFYIKLSKCSFGVNTIEYLGHIISAGELRADKAKIEAMVAWPTPTTIKQLR
ncbi:uncharacterized protein LOC125200430, partial [Salvia hispanica]|uniref:uncharacterized protein LOC125200430 n=1 Tax=Salvia hispanica TaxID=49212 RepID=UPI0020095481